MYKWNMTLPQDICMTGGDSIHASTDRRTGEINPPHLTGSCNGKTVHTPYYGQTTLGMFDSSLGAHRISDVQNLHEQFPSVFGNSGFGSPIAR